jgi:hypothetical protein
MVYTQTIEIPASRRLTISIPREIPAGRAVIAFTPAEPNWKKERVFGCAKGSGEYWMAEDFDAPLNDFKDYM